MCHHCCRRRRRRPGHKHTAHQTHKIPERETFVFVYKQTNKWTNNWTDIPLYICLYGLYESSSSHYIRTISALVIFTHLQHEHTFDTRRRIHICFPIFSFEFFLPSQRTQWPLSSMPSRHFKTSQSDESGAREMHSNPLYRIFIFHFCFRNCWCCLWLCLATWSRGWWLLFSCWTWRRCLRQKLNNTSKFDSIELWNPLLIRLTLGMPWPKTNDQQFFRIQTENMICSWDSLIIGHFDAEEKQSINYIFEHGKKIDDVQPEHEHIFGIFLELLLPLVSLHTLNHEMQTLIRRHTVQSSDPFSLSL